MFCGKCGKQIPDNSKVCPYCGERLEAAAPQTGMNMNLNLKMDTKTLAIISLSTGIASVVLAILGGILFGVIAALIACLVGAVAVVTGINVKKKEDNNSFATGGFICGLLGMVFGLVFAAGCAMCACNEKAQFGSCYTCYGTVGGNCAARCAVSRYERELEHLFDF